MCTPGRKTARRKIALQRFVFRWRKKSRVCTSCRQSDGQQIGLWPCGYTFRASKRKQTVRSGRGQMRPKYRASKRKQTVPLGRRKKCTNRSRRAKRLIFLANIWIKWFLKPNTPLRNRHTPLYLGGSDFLKPNTSYWMPSFSRDNNSASPRS